ncbi:MAG: PAS domain S-box protein, partial [Kangiellaceae bacterium]|nr:PAS domain S-box protein [Kangiellaceae bacterium]
HQLQQEVTQHLETTQQLHVSEHYINSILKSLPSMLVGLDPKGRVTQWNEKAEKYTGITTEKAIGNDLWETYPIITITRDQVDVALTKSSPTTIRQSQRGLFHFDITIYPLHTTGESGVVLLLDDVSKQVKSENKLIQKDKLSSMGELESSMAHDMNIQLQSMLKDINQIQQKVRRFSQSNTGSADLVEVSENLTDAVEQGKRAGAIIENLLDYATAQIDDKQTADLTDVMERSLDLAKDILSHPNGLNFRDVNIKKEYDDDLPKLDCHIAEIQQVFFSLLRHCFHSVATINKKDFQPLIKIRALEGYDSLWLQISHNGVGLTSEEQQSIFEPYFSNQPLDSEDDANKRLSFPHFVITEQHSGHMAVTSDIKLGTTFHIQFS